MENKITSFSDRADTLRREIIDAIVCLLREHNLTEIELSRCPSKQPYVVWFDRRGYGYDSRVTKTAVYGNGISVEVYDEDCCCTETLTSDQYDIACTNIDWLIGILDAVNYTLSLPKSEGTIAIGGHIVEWSYKEPGLCELSEEAHDEIAAQFIEEQTQGKLCYYDDEDVEYEGVWKIKQEAMTRHQTTY